jgi:hypothetical protein
MAESLTIQVPGKTRELIERLKQSFSVKTDAEVLTGALGLATTAVKVAGNAKVVTLSGDTEENNITVSLDK